MFSLRYVDKRRFAISAIQDFNSMKTIIDITPESLKEPKNKLNIETTGRTSYIQDEKPTEDIGFMEKRYKNAIIYMDWFLPAWNRLKKQDQNILREFYMNEDSGSGASIRLQHALNYSERHIDRLRIDALESFSFLLLGE